MLLCRVELCDSEPDDLPKAHSHPGLDELPYVMVLHIIYV